MQTAYVVTGTTTDRHTIALDEPLPVGTGRVRLVVEPMEQQPRRSYDEMMADIRRRQRARGHVPPTAEQVDAEIERERASWD